MDPRYAELTKYAANAMLATRMSFMNDIAMLCEKVGADVDFVRKGLGADRRIGYPFLFPGIGYGGFSFPKGTQTLISPRPGVGMKFALLRAGERTNSRQKRTVVQQGVRTFSPLPGPP